MWHKFSGTGAINLGNKRFFFYSVDKDKELFKMNFEGLDLFFKTLDSQGRKGIGHAMVLIDGYNDVTTELFEVPQVRKYVKEMFNRYPHLLNYIDFDLEGHHWLLASWLDMLAVHGGKKMTFEEHIKKFGPHMPMPRFNIRLDMPKEKLNSTISTMRAHGRKIRADRNVEQQVNRLRSIFMN